MANSRPKHHDPLAPWLPARTPGPLGVNDAADPSVEACAGDTPGPLGCNDHAALQSERVFGADALVVQSRNSHLTHIRPPGPAGLARSKPLLSYYPGQVVHGTGKPNRVTLEGSKRLHDTQQASSHSYIVSYENVKLQFEDREGLVAEIYFATDESSIDAQDKAELLKVYNFYAKLLQAPSLRANPPKVHFKFVGYADKRGSERHNLGLSRKRAIAVGQYFSPLRSSPHYSEGTIAMGEAEHPQSVSPTGGPVSAQLSRYRRVDVFARPVLTKVPDPQPIPIPELGSHSWTIRLIDSASGSFVAAGGMVARLEIVDMTHQMGMTFRFKALGLSAGAKVSASMDSSKWQYFTTPLALTFDDFEGPTDHIGEAVAFGYGYAVDRFILHGPRDKGPASKSVAVKFTGWGRAVAGGADLTHGSLSKGAGPYPAGPDYLAAPPPGSQIKW